jgi:proteasome assembly chaperone (PAC2) family protein
MPATNLQWETEPELRAPVLIAAFEGWNDAADAASNAVTWLRHRWRASRFAWLEPDDYYDFQATRPRVSVHNGVLRTLRWPTNEFSAAALGGHAHDVVLFSGVEPNVHWRDFCASVVSVAHATHCQMVVTLGALLADVPHTRPVQLTTTAVDRELAERLHLQRSRYEGPTGIVGVLHDACHRAGLASVSLWAPVPHYVATPPNPKATAALLDHISQLLSVEVDADELHSAAHAWETRVDELVAADDEVANYVRQLEEQSDMVFGADGDGDDHVDFGDRELGSLSADEIADELERYLREREEGDS